MVKISDENNENNHYNDVDAVDDDEYLNTGDEELEENKELISKILQDRSKLMMLMMINSLQH